MNWAAFALGIAVGMTLFWFLWPRLVRLGFRDKNFEAIVEGLKTESLVKTLNILNEEMDRRRRALEEIR